MRRHDPTPSPAPALRPGARGGSASPAFRGLWLPLLSLLAFLPFSGPSATPHPTEYQLKATFLYNFIRFADWPESAFAAPSDPIVVGVLGEDPFGPILDRLLGDEQVRRRPLLIRRFASAAQLGHCHLLFVARSEKDRLPDIWTALGKKAVLTMSDVPHFCEQGGMIGLELTAAGTIQPEVAPAPVRAAGLAISSKVLNLPMMRIVNARQ